MENYWDSGNSMGNLGCLWLFMVVYGCLWLFMVVYVFFGGKSMGNNFFFKYFVWWKIN